MFVNFQQWLIRNTSNAVLGIASWDCNCSLELFFSTKIVAFIMTQLCVFFFSLSLEGHAAVYGWEEIQYKVWWLPVDWKWTQSCIYNFLHQPFYGCFGSLINNFYRFYSFYPTYYQLVCLYIYLTFFKPLLVLLLLSLLLLLLKDGVVVVVIFGYFTVWCFILVLDIGTYTLATYCGVPLISLTWLGSWRLLLLYFSILISLILLVLLSHIPVSPLHLPPLAVCLPEFCGVWDCYFLLVQYSDLSF